MSKQLVLPYTQLRYLALERLHWQWYSELQQVLAHIQSSRVQMHECVCERDILLFMRECEVVSLMMPRML